MFLFSENKMCNLSAQATIFSPESLYNSSFGSRRFQDSIELKRWHQT